jgi:hypothetical protein
MSMSQSFQSGGGRGHYSRLTSVAFLSSRSPINRLWRRWTSSVHSTNSKYPTSTGFSHRHSTILAAVSPAPQRPAFFSGRLAKGHSLISSGLILLNSSARDAGVNPLRVRAGVYQPVAVIIADDQRVEILGRWRVTGDDEFLAPDNLAIIKRPKLHDKSRP